MGALGFQSETEELTYLRQRVADLEWQAVRPHQTASDAGALMQTFLDHLPIHAWIKDQYGRYAYANRSMQEFFQREGRAWFGANDRDLWPHETALRMSARDRKTALGTPCSPCVETVPSLGGDRHWLTVRFPFQSAAAESCFAGIATDITEKVQLEMELRDQPIGGETVRAQAISILETLRQSEVRVERLFQSDLIGMMECKGETIVDSNDALLNWLGLTRDDLSGRSVNWRELTPARFHRADELALDELRSQGSCKTYEKAFVARDGKTVPVMVGGTALDARQGSFIVFIVNLSERKQMEQRLLRSQKLESLGLIAGGVAHDINNLLATIMGNASLSLDAVSAEHPAYRTLSEVVLATRRASDLTQQVLAYSGRAHFSIKPVNITVAVREIGSLLETTISKKIQLSFDLNANLPFIDGDEGQIQQVIMNLVINASDAIGENAGEIAVKTDFAESEEWVCFEVRDTGCGMAPETQARIFDPFFTTKPHGRGLGLAAVLGVMESHGGALKVESAVGKGTIFRALFPVSKRQIETVAPPMSRLDIWGSETILVADDDQGIRRMTKAALERLGYRVLTASDGQEAVDSFHEHASSIDVILLDWAMPVMNGEEALRQILLIDPNARVLMSSGYAEAETLQRIGADSLAGFMQKPYTTTQLAQRLREVLSGVPAETSTA